MLMLNDASHNEMVGWLKVQSERFSGGGGAVGVNRKCPTSPLLTGWSPVPGQLIRTLRNPDGLVSVLLVVLGCFSGWFWVGSVWLMYWLCCRDSVSKNTDARLARCGTWFWILPDWDQHLGGGGQAWVGVRGAP